MVEQPWPTVFKDNTSWTKNFGNLYQTQAIYYGSVIACAQFHSLKKKTNDEAKITTKVRVQQIKKVKST